MILTRNEDVGLSLPDGELLKCIGCHIHLILCAATEDDITVELILEDVVWLKMLLTKLLK